MSTLRWSEGRRSVDMNFLPKRRNDKRSFVQSCLITTARNQGRPRRSGYRTCSDSRRTTTEISNISPIISNELSLSTILAMPIPRHDSRPHACHWCERRRGLGGDDNNSNTSISNRGMKSGLESWYAVTSSSVRPSIKLTGSPQMDVNVEVVGGTP